MTRVGALKNKALLTMIVSAIATAWGAGPARGQEVDSIPGVRLGLVYETTYVPVLAIKSFTGRFGGVGVASAR